MKDKTFKLLFSGVLSGLLASYPVPMQFFFIGVVVGKRDGLACVQVAGFVTLHYTGTTAPTVGECALAGDGKGGVAVTENAKKYRVLRVDTAAKTVGLYL